MQKADQIGAAAHARDYAITLCIRAPPPGPECETLMACDQRPTITNIRPALAIVRGRPWLALIESALIEIALATVDDVLSEADNDHRE